MCSGMSFVLMHWCHVGCMIVDVGAMSFGNFLFSVLAGWRRVALRVCGGGWLDVVCSRPVGVVCFGDQGVPFGDPCFPQWCEVFE